MSWWGSVLSAEECMFINGKIIILAPNFTNISIFMYSSPLNFDYVCFVIIWVFNVFHAYFGHFMIIEKSDSKTYRIF